MKQITFSKQLLKKAEIKALEFGLTFNEYVRHLVVNDTTGSYPMVSEQTEKAIADSLHDISEGEYTTLSSPLEVKNYFKKLRKK